MNKKDITEKVIQNYQEDEKMMVLVFAQWCVNHGLDPEEVYLKAYPNQASNPTLQQALELTVSKDEAGHIEDQTLLGVLSLFGNDELAFIVTDEITRLKKR